MNIGDRTVFARGDFVKYDDARVGLLTHGLNYGTGCFEGIRGYWNAEDGELYLLQLREHFERLQHSAKTLLMEVPHTVDELIEVTLELCTRNRYEENVYIRPLLFKGAEDVGVRLLGVEDSFAIIVVPFHGYYDAESGLRAGVSSWRRIDDTMAPARAKITGAYINSALAKSEAQLNGYDEAIMLSFDGHVAEGSAANLFLVKRGVLHTPDASGNCLEGITRRSVIGLAKCELGMPVIERTIDRSELYAADELFVTGTAAGISFISSVDHRTVGDGKIGPVTKRLGEIHERIRMGREPKYRAWVTAAYASRKVEGELISSMPSLRPPSFMSK